MLKWAQKLYGLFSGEAGWQVNAFLQENRAGINSFINQMDRYAGPSNTRIDRLADGVKSRELGQQRRVNIYDAVGECSEETVG
jgi:hypothetical protein